MMILNPNQIDNKDQPTQGPCQSPPIWMFVCRVPVVRCLPRHRHVLGGLIFTGALCSHFYPQSLFIDKKPETQGDEHAPHHRIIN